MKEGRFEHLVKILTIGESAVGKSCLIQRFTKNEFSPHHTSTIAIDFKMKVIEINNVRLKMQIWDTAGQERFNTLTAGFFKGSDGIVLTYSVTDEKSFQCVNKWMDQVQKLAPVDVKVILIGNKADLDAERKVSREEGEAMALKYGIKFYETSAKSGENVQELFLDIGNQIFEKIEQNPPAWMTASKGPNMSSMMTKPKLSCCGGAPRET